MNREDILKKAREQSAIEMNCSPEDFLKEDNVITEFGMKEGYRRYYQQPIACNFVSYGNNAVASVQEPLRGIVREYLEKFTFYHCFETPNLHWLNERMLPFGQKICFMAEYFLPDPEKLPDTNCGYPVRVLEKEDFGPLYLPEWSNALTAHRPEYDILGTGAYDGEKLIGLAACSADCETMWQIGIDVLPEYRKKGIATALVSSLSAEILKRGRVPFYCAAWSNLRSVHTALSSGFFPAWVEMTVKPAEKVDEMNS